MIITCIKCDKKFNVESSLIPENGRLLVCSKCNHKWFFKKVNENIPNQPIETDPPKDEVKPFESESPKDQIELEEVDDSRTIELLDKGNKQDLVTEKILEKRDKKVSINLTKKKKKSYKVLSLTILFIVFFISLIIIADTFKTPISKFFPNIEFLLYNLYESIKDIILFFSDLI